MYRLVILNYNDKIIIMIQQIFLHLNIKRVIYILLTRGHDFNVYTCFYTTQWLNQWIYAYHPPCSSYGLQV